MENNQVMKNQLEVFLRRNDEMLTMLDELEEKMNRLEGYLKEKKQNERIEVISSPPKLTGYDFFKKVLKSPKYLVAPMVDCSELSFRLLCRRYGAQLCYTPMFHSINFHSSPSYRKHHFSTCPEDRPLIVQFCGNVPEHVLKAAKMVEDECDAIDLNLGCPQRIAKRGNYGSFLMDSPEVVYEIVNTLHKNLKIPIFCKIRVFPSLEKTIEFSKMLERAGCSLLTVHGRTKEMKGVNQGLADWNAIRKIKESLSIPVISNGNILDFEDVKKCMEETGVDGVMSAWGILRNPALFSGKIIDKYSLCYEYLDLCKEYPTPHLNMKNHLCKILEQDLAANPTLRDAFFSTKGIEPYIKMVKLIESVAKGEVKIEETFTASRKKTDLDLDEILTAGDLSLISL